MTYDDFNERVDFEFARITDAVVNEDSVVVYLREVIIDNEMVPRCAISFHHVKMSVRNISEYEIDPDTGKTIGFKSRQKVSDGPFLDFEGSTNLYFLDASYETDQGLVSSWSWRIEAERYSIREL